MHYIQITKLAKRIFHSPLLTEDLEKCCIHAKIIPKRIKRSVATRWNSVAEMLCSALYLRDALDTLCVNEKHNMVKKTALRRLKLSKKEWEVVKDLERVLGVC
jgi:hypothetical protein